MIADWKRERPELNAQPMAVVGRLLQLGTRLEKSASEALEPFGIHYTDLDLLATLRRSDKPYRLTPTVLRRSVLLSSGAMTAALDRLEKRELLTRTPDPTDRRVRAVALTPAGKKLIDKAIETRFAEAEIAIDKLNKKEQRELASLLRRLLLP